MLSLFRPHRRSALLVLLALAMHLPAQTPSGTAASAILLDQPAGLAFDSAGNLFIAEAGSHRIRRLTPDGTVVTLAGSSQGFAGEGSLATATQLDAPRGLALDSSGNLYIADSHNHRIRRIDAKSSSITTIAGTGIEGFSGDSGPAATARLAAPSALALDASNHLYLADSRNHRIRQLNLTTGIITTVAGNGTQGFRGDGAAAVKASLDTPLGIALDAAGGLYIADTGNRRVRFVDPVTGVITTVAGASATSPALRRPVALAFAAGSLVVADAGRHQLLRLDPASGALSTLSGTGAQDFGGDGASAVAAQLNTPSAVAISSAGAIAFADSGNARIRSIDPILATISTIAGLGTTVQGTLTLSGASVQAYGAASLSAVLSSAAARGSLSLFESSGGATTLVAQTALAGAQTALTAPSLPVGQHRLFATYSGDTSHRAAQSSTFALTIAPRDLTATILAPPSLLFGQAIPALSATLSGALPADTAALSLAVTTSASAASPPGAYPIRIALSGSAAANYRLIAPDSSLTIAKAPVSVSLLASGTTLTAQVASSTTGTPGGALTLLSTAGQRLATAPLNTSGAAILSTSGMPDGDYQLTAIYSGDTNFLSAQSTRLALTLGVPRVPADFAIASAGAPTQTIHAGEVATFPFTFKSLGSSSLAGPVVLSVSGLPAFATASFNPTLIPPGGAVGSFQLVVTTPRSASALRVPPTLFFALLLPLLGFRFIRRSARLPIALLSLCLVAICGCGARVNTAASASGPGVQTSTLTVTGTTTLLDGSVLQHSTTATLIVQ